MIVYEVNLWVQPEVLDEYRAWLDGHIREILALPGFAGATVFDVLDTPARDGHPAGTQACLSVQYRLDDESVLADYLREHAPRLRAEGMARFAGKFTAERRVMRLATDYGNGAAGNGRGRVDRAGAASD